MLHLIKIVGTVYDLTVYVNYKEGTPNVDPKEFDIADDETAGTYLW